MKSPEESLAVDLHRALTRQFNSPATTVSIRGRGSNWRCTAQRGDSLCEINCFASLSLGAEYYTLFKRASIQTATSRIPSRDDTIAAVRDWLDGQDLSTLYDRYPFVDRAKRALTRIRDDALSNAPELQTAARSELERRFEQLYCLHFRSGDRSCELSFYGKNELPDARFSWDDCQLFEFQPDDNLRFAAVLKRWLCDRSSPSTMRTEFPWLEIGVLADYYESGEPIEGEFILSWNRIEQRYQEEGCTFSDAVLAMIHAMRRAGYDRLLRAGTSMFSLGLSRSRRHGLSEGQPCVWFEFHDPVMDVHADFAATKLKRHPIQFTKDVQRLLDAIVEFEID